MKSSIRSAYKLAAVSGIVTSALFAFAGNALAAGPAAINLLSTGNFAVLAETTITTTGVTAITGDVGISPAAASLITGFGLILDPSTTFSTSALVTGKVYAADYTAPTPATMTTAVNDMLTAYNAAAGVPTPTATELGSGNIGGMTLAPGLYKWSTDVSIPTNVTLSGGPNDVWIFQISGDLNIAPEGDINSGIKVVLAGGAQASNVFWQVGGLTGATLGTYSTFNGTILSAKQVIIETGAVLNGRALAQTQVTLDANTVTIPTSAPTISAPMVTNVATSTGSTAGGTSVTVTGSGFTGATAVNFGSTPATAFNVNSDSSIAATSSAGTGTVDVTVTTSGGTSATSAADKFTYVIPSAPCTGAIGNPLLVDVTQNISNDADSGVQGNYWALDDYARHIQVWLDSGTTYCAQVDYNGTFHAPAGVLSPQNGNLIKENIDGTMIGGYRASIVGTRLIPQTIPTTVNYEGVVSTGAVPGYVSWLDNTFSSEYVFNSGTEVWSWTYTTSNNGTWTNSGTGNSGDIINSPPTNATRDSEVLKAADRLIALQNSDGGWDWIVTGASAGTAGTAYNVTGVTALGLLDAYTLSNDPKYLTAAKKAGDYIVGTAISPTQGQNAYNAVFLQDLTTDTASSMYSTKANDILTSIFSGDNKWARTSGSFCNAVTGCTPAQLVSGYANYRSGNRGMVPWDVAPFVLAEVKAGNTSLAQSIEAAVAADRANYTNAAANYDIGLAGMVIAAKAVNDPNLGTYVTELVSRQNSDGSSGLVGDGQVQTTSYVLRGLMSAGGNASAVNSAVAFISSKFGYSSIDGWKDTDGSEYAEIDGEAIHAIFSFLPSDTFYAAPTVSGNQTSAHFPAAITQTGSSDGVAVTAVIPANTTFIADNSSWDGSISAPTATTTTVTVSGFDTTVTSAVTVGSSDSDLTFDNAVKLTFAGQAGTLVGYYDHAGIFHEITDTCSANDQTTENASLAAGASCKIDASPDLIVWTKHFSTFVTYTQTPVSAPASPAPAAHFYGGGGGYSNVAAANVGISDFVRLMANWGQTGIGNTADFSGDAVVGIQDFVWLMANWTK